ncbi:MAG: MFS transporter [Acidimicrobiales bacterium]
MNRTFRSLRVRNYRLFASGQVVSLTGTWMQRVSQDWLVTELTHTSGTAGTSLGFTTALQFLPLLLFGLYGGMIADRFPKRRILLFTQSSMCVLAVTLGILDVSGLVTLWEVYVLAFLLGVATAVDSPTRQAFVIEMVGPDDVVNAVGLNSATFNTARVVGPAVAGLLISLVGTGTVFLLNACSFAAVLGSLLAMRDSELFSARPVARARRQLRAGLAYVRGRPALYLPIILAGVIGTLGFNFQITLVLMDRTVFHLGAGAYGLLSSALAVGSLAGALLAARRGRPRLRLLVGAALAFGIFEVLCGLMPTYDALALLLLPTGAISLTFSTTANSSVQLASEQSMRGRVMGLYMLVFAGGTPFGAPLVGWLAQTYGARWSFWVGGGASALAALSIGALLLWWRRDQLAGARLSRMRRSGQSGTRRPEDYPALAPVGGGSEGADAVSAAEVAELATERDPANPDPEEEEGSTTGASRSGASSQG